MTTLQIGLIILGAIIGLWFQYSEVNHKIIDNIGATIVGTVIGFLIYYLGIFILYVIGFLLVLVIIKIIFKPNTLVINKK